MKLGILLAGFISAMSFGLDQGNKAPNVQLDEIQMDGSVWPGRDVLNRGISQKFVILNFFQTTCGPCVAEQPDINVLGKEVSQWATLRMVALDRTVKRVTDYQTSNN